MIHDHLLNEHKWLPLTKNSKTDTPWLWRACCLSTDPAGPAQFMIAYSFNAATHTIHATQFIIASTAAPWQQIN